MNEIFTEAPTGAGLSYTANNAGPVNQSTQLEVEQSPFDTEQEKMFDFNNARIHLDRIITDWHTEIEDTEVRRKTRDVEIDIEGLRQKGDLDEDETLVPVRVIDTNITREQPPYINYLKNSRRISIFRSLSKPNQDAQNIESEFTRGMTYAGWETPHYKCLDGAQTHGWAAVEVSYDTSKPLNVGLEYIEHDCLFWPRSVKDIQDSPRIIRKYDITLMKLKKWVRDFGFKLDQVNKLAQSRRNNQKENETITVYKLLFKKENVVYVAWFALTDGVDDWLKAPEKLFLGIKHKVQSSIVDQFGQPQQTEQWVDTDIELYPIFVQPYRETEKPKVVDRKGRVFLDENKQEAQTAILSGFINGLTRASNVYAAPQSEDGSGDSLKELEDIKLCGGRILSKPMQFWHTEYPDAMVIRALQWFDVSNSQETNQVNFATMNREDSRKTAKEITSSENQQSLLTGVALTLFSTHIRFVYSFAWLIVQSQALQGAIRFLLVNKPQPQINPITQQPILDPQSGQPLMMDNWINDVEVIGQTWEVRAAGDVDVVQRQEKVASMQQDWPVIMNTPLKDRFLADYVKLKYPDVGEEYAAILMQAPMMQQLQSLVARLATVMNGMAQENPDMINNLPAQQRSEVAQLMQEGMAVAQQMGGGMQQ